MILSFGPTGEDGSATALALGLPSLVAVIAYLAAALPIGRRHGVPQTALVLGWVAHAVAILIDIAGWGSPVAGARFGFAPALSLTLWLVLGAYGVESRLLPLPAARRSLAALGVAVVALAWLFPGDVRPEAPPRWLQLHITLMMASYGLFGVAVLHAAMLNRAERQLRSTALAAPAAPKGVPLLRLERLTFRFVRVGFAVLSAALLLGAWFADPWRWDHKTVFSLMGWIVVAGLLIGRRAFGWRGPRATRWLYAGTGLLLLAYVGSRFVLEVLLHRPPLA